MEPDGKSVYIRQDQTVDDLSVRTPVLRASTGPGMTSKPAVDPVLGHPSW
jgi:hypothetical protein